MSLYTSFKAATGLSDSAITTGAALATVIGAVALVAPPIAAAAVVGAALTVGSAYLMAKAGHRQLGADQLVGLAVVGSVLGLIPGGLAGSVARGVSAAGVAGVAAGAEVALNLDKTDAPGLGVRVETKDHALHVTGVTSGSKADRLGMKPGDVIDTVNNHPIMNTDVLDRASAAPGLEVDVTRAGKPVELTLEPAKAPRHLGITYAPLFEDGNGVVVTSVYAGSAADRAGLAKGDLLRAIDGHETWDPGSLARALSLASDSPKFSILRRGKQLDLETTFVAPAPSRTTGVAGALGAAESP